MASPKDTFEPVTFGADCFACGTFRGLGSAVVASATAAWQYAIFAGNKGHALCELNKPHAIWAGNKGHVASNDQP